MERITNGEKVHWLPGAFLTSGVAGKQGESYFFMSFYLNK